MRSFGVLGPALAVLLPTHGTRPTQLGCAAPTLGPGRRQRQSVVVPGAQHADARKYEVTVPFGSGPFPVLFAYHGYTNSADEIANEHSFDELAEREGFIVVYADGMRDGPHGGSWNLGAQSEDTCAAPVATACYDSCEAAGCGACAWHTCADDLAFSDAMIAGLGAVACVDMTRLYLYGESAGAMFTYRLLRERPGVYAAAVPEQGLPYAGTSALPHTAMPAILHLHDRQDKTVPLQGGKSEDGWLYDGLRATLQQACGGASRAPYPTKLPKVECTEYLGCTGGPVVACLYDGKHGDLPDGTVLQGLAKAGLSDEFIWDFLKDFHSEGVPVLEGLAARWERYCLAGLLAAVIVSAIAVARATNDKAAGEATALLE